jgi:hypothetical protein
MECDKAENLMMLYMDRALPEQDAAVLNKHIKECAKCREDFFTYDKILSELSIQKVYSPPEGFEGAVMEKIRALDYKRPVSANKDSLFCVIWGVFSILFGTGLIAMMYKDSITSYLAATGRFDGFIQTVGPVTDYVFNLTEQLMLLVTLLGANFIELVSGLRFALLLICFVLAGVQYFIFRKNKAEI